MTTLNEQIARLLHPDYEIIRMGNKVGYEASYNELGKELTQNVDPDAVFDFVELPNYSEDLNAAWELLPLFKNQFTAKAAVEAALNFGLQPSQVARQICEALLTEAENGE